MNDEKSYNHYKQRQSNRARYEDEQIAFPIGIMVLIIVFVKYWEIVVPIAVLVLTLFLYLKAKRKHTMKSTEIGYTNKNNQRNNGCTNEIGSDNNQKFYAMECLNCGNRYKANGTDIWQRKCPKCQGGKN